MGHLLVAIEQQIAAFHFELLNGAQIKPTSLDLVGALMQNTPTLIKALKDFATYQHRNVDGGIAYLLPVNDRVTFGYGIYQARPRPST